MLHICAFQPARFQKFGENLPHVSWEHDWKWKGLHGLNGEDGCGGTRKCFPWSSADKEMANQENKHEKEDSAGFEKIKHSREHYHRGQARALHTVKNMLDDPSSL